jgi:hypothetical protein
MSLLRESEKRRHPLWTLIVLITWALNPGVLHASVPGQSLTVAQAAKRIDEKLGELQRGIDSDNSDVWGAGIEWLSQEFDILQEKTIMIFGERRAQWAAAKQDFSAALTEDAAHRKTLARMRAAWKNLRALYPAEALEILPPLWSCPMHSEIIDANAASCPICGMSLEPIYVTQPALSLDPIIRAEMVHSEPLVVGKEGKFRVRLIFNNGGTPVRFEDLDVAHTRKIHLLIVDSSETDYHHEHPEPVGNGEYAFSFTPQRSGPYRLWADLKPALTHIQQYSIVDIPAADSSGQFLSDEPEVSEAEAQGYQFRLTFENPILLPKHTVLGRLQVTGPDGKPFDKLEVVMGAFGHFVGFCEDYSTVMHIHPVGPALDDHPEARGGPELQFYFRANAPGLVRLFTQVQIDGKNLFPRFAVRVRQFPAARIIR